MMKKINRLKRKGHVKLNVQDSEKVGRTRKNEVWLKLRTDSEKEKLEKGH